MPGLLLLRERTSSWVWNTEENGARKEHTEQEPKPSLYALMTWLAVPSPNKFLRLFLLLLLYHSGKIAIPNYHLFLLLQILHLILLKSLQRQGNLIISGDSRVVFWWARYGNHQLSFLKRADLPSVWNGFVAIYFLPISVRQFQKVVLLVLQQCGDDCVNIGGR